jgi:hypothetical protein
MREAGQFISGINNPLAFISSFGFIATVAMIFVVWRIYKGFFLPIYPGLTFRSLIFSILIAAVLGITITLLMQIVATIYTSILASYSNSPNKRIPLGISRAIYKMVSELHGKGRFLIIFVFVTLFLIGGGYAIADITDSFLLRLLGFTGGVGLLEELSKAVAGLFLYRRFFMKHNHGLFVAFALAGLGFGIGEAFHYFGIYNEDNRGLLIYLLRAFWCMPLHSAWAIIIVSFGEQQLLKQIDDNTGSIENTDKFIMLLLVSTPSILLHGFYDTFASYGDKWMWLVGILSFFLAFNYQKKLRNISFAEL